MNDTTADTLLDRTCSAMVEAMTGADSSATWISQMAQLTLAHLAAELIVIEELAERPLTLQDACAFLLQGVEP
jgi:hypothetical protein